MRFVVLVALLGLAAASCPFGSKKCFNQLLQGSQGQQSRFGQMYGYGDEDDSDMDDYEGQQQQTGRYQFGYEDEEEGPQCQGPECEEPECEGPECEGAECEGPGCYGPQEYGPQGQQQCKPNYQLLQQLEQPNCHLAAKLYKQAKTERDDKNTVVSPAAIQVTLAALQKGARGNTKTQIKRTQCPRLSQKQCQQAHAALIRVLKGTNNVQKTQRPGQQTNGQQKAKINFATGIVVNQQTCAQRQFVQTVQKCLGGQVKKCSFKTSPQQCRQQINQLVSAKTCQKVKNIVPQEAVTDNTKMVAVSALQMQAKWGRQFRQQQTTKPARFYPLGSQKPKQCQAIQSQGRFNYYEDNQVQVVGIPTEQQELTMYVIVPKEKDGLTQVEKEQIQNGQQLKQLLDNCDQQKQYTRVQLPKIQITHKMDAKKTLMQQGVQDAFDCDQADFSGICSKQQQQQQQQQNLHLNKLIHQATIKINEQGISSANTGSQQDQIEQSQEQYQQQYQHQYKQDDEEEYGQEYGHGEKYGQQYGEQYGQGAEAQVKANRAFAFAIKHNPSNQIVLVGRVIDGCQKPQGQQGQQGFQGQGIDSENEWDEE